MLPASEPIPRRKLSDEVFDRLKRMIMSGEARPGQTLPSERELMDRFGVGRPAIREAMQALASAIERSSAQAGEAAARARHGVDMAGQSSRMVVQLD